MNDNCKSNAIIFKAFSDENRLMILNLLRQKEHCACSLLEELQISQSTLSHHMKILCTSNIVSSRRDGKWTYYSLNQEGIAISQAFLDRLASNETGNSCLCDK